GAKQGLGTSTTAASKVWYTLGQGITDEVYYPQTDTPDVQDLQYVVTDGSTFTDLERDATTHQVSLPDPQSLTYQQVNTATSGRHSGTASAGYPDLLAHRQLTAQFDTAGAPGNLVQTAEVTVGADTTFTLALAFGATRSDASANSSASLQAGWSSVAANYQ